jgi:hypothetical protein
MPDKQMDRKKEVIVMSDVRVGGKPLGVRTVSLRGNTESVMSKLGGNTFNLTPGVASQVCAISALGYKFSEAFLHALQTVKALQGLFTTGLLLREISTGDIDKMYEVDVLNRGLRYKDNFYLDRDHRTFVLKIEI